MHTNDADLEPEITDEELNDPDFDIPEITDEQMSSGRVGGLWYLVKDGFDIGIDGAVGYRLRLIPSNKVLATGSTAREVFAAYLREVKAGRSYRTLIVDWCAEDGEPGKLSSGATLAELAQASVHGAKTLARNQGLPIPS